MEFLLVSKKGINFIIKISSRLIFSLLIFCAFDLKASDFDDNLVNKFFSLGMHKSLGLIISEYEPIIDSELIGSNNSEKTKSKTVKKDKELSVRFEKNSLLTNSSIGGSFSLSYAEASILYPHGINKIPFPIIINSNAVNLTSKIFNKFQISDNFSTKLGLAIMKSNSKQKLKFGDVLIYDNKIFLKSFSFAELIFAPKIYSKLNLSLEINNLKSISWYFSFSYKL